MHFFEFPSTTIFVEVVPAVVQAAASAAAAGCLRGGGQFGRTTPGPGLRAPASKKNSLSLTSKKKEQKDKKNH